MGNSAYRPAPSNQNLEQDLRNFMQVDLPKFVLQSKIGNGKFMKSYIMRVDSTQLVVKVYMKLADEDVQIPAVLLTKLWRTIPPSKYPNLMPYQMWIKSNSRIKAAQSPVYLIRQYFNSNLSDRLSTRPFLNHLEKCWLIFQLFKCLEICHEHDIFHGDIKPENIMCTTSNWLVLTDFSPYKPTVVPDDDPTNFQYFFDCMSRHKCYLAPERFYKKDIKVKNADSQTASNRNRSKTKVGYSDGDINHLQVTAAMDVFSLGCVMAEIMMDGTPLFDLPGMLQYLSSSAESIGLSAYPNNPKAFMDESPLSPGSTLSTSTTTRPEIEEFPAKQLISRIQDPLLRQVIVDMTQKDPARRLSATDYLKLLQGKNSPKTTETPDEVKVTSFPNYFESCIYPLNMKLHWNGVTPDDRVKIICESYDDIMMQVVGIRDELGSLFFEMSLEPSSRSLFPSSVAEQKSSMLLLPAAAQTLSKPQPISPVSPEQKKEVLARSNARERAGITPLHNPANASLLEIQQAVDNLTAKMKVLDEGVDAQDPADDADPLMEKNAMDLLSKPGFFDVAKDNSGTRLQSDGLVLIIDILCSNYRHLKLLPLRIITILMLGRVGRMCTDAVILQRIIPLLLVAIEDVSAIVRVSALRAVTALLTLVEKLDPIEVNYFPQYVFPCLARISKDVELVVRMAFADCLGKLAVTARRFLDVGHIDYLRKQSTEAASNNLDEDKILYDYPYDQKLEALKELVARLIRDLLTDNNNNLSSTANPPELRKLRAFVTYDSAVKKVLLGNVVDFCHFFGQESALEKLLTQLLTFLNDQDWELREAFCKNIVSVGAFVGPTVTSEYIVPCLENTLYDVEERVTVSTVHAITSLVQLNLVSRLLVVEFVDKCKALLIHSSTFIRKAVVCLIVACCTQLGAVDTSIHILPQISELLRYELMPNNISERTLSNALIGALSRDVIKKELLTKLEELSAASGMTWKVNDMFFSAIRLNPNATQPNELSSGKSNTFDDDCSDDKKVEIMSSYLKAASREIYTKTLRWKSLTTDVQQNSRSLFRQTMLSTPSSQQKSPPNDLANVLKNMELTLNWTNIVNENSINSILIPNMKSASYIPDDLRKQNIFLDNDEERNFHKIRSLFMGIGTRDSSRGIVMSAIDQGDEAADRQNTGGAMASNQAISGQPSVSAPLKTMQVKVPGAPTPSNLDVSFPTSHYSYANLNSTSILKRIKALKIPPLPTDLGQLLPPTEDPRQFSDFNEANLGSESSRSAAWRPKEGALLMTLREHSASVNRLVVSPDQSYFASASSDHTVRIWQTKQLDRMAFPKSSAIYAKHNSAVMDACAIENTHSISTCSKDGKVHVWRVELAMGSNQKAPDSVSVDSAGVGNNYTRFNVVGSSIVKSIDPEEGSVLSVQHYNSEIASVLTFATQRGGIHGWDLRMPDQAFRFALRPELGYCTSMTIAPDRNWICAGTSKGFITLFDIRYNVVSQVWQHSAATPIHRLACCKAVRYNYSSGQTIPGLPPTEGAYLFVATANNEAAVWGIPEGGECFKCFRSLSLDDSKAPVVPLPRLDPVNLPRHPMAPIRAISDNVPDGLGQLSSPSVRAMIGRISPNNSSYLITAGSDRQIRFWDFRTPESCYTIAGLEAAQPKSIFVSRKVDDRPAGKLFVCYSSSTPSADKILQSHLPVRESRGLTLPTVNYKDTILDLKDVDVPIKLLLSSSRDGEIKIWR